MTATTQIVFGTVLLLVCAAFHVAMIVVAVRLLAKLVAMFDWHGSVNKMSMRHQLALIAAAFSSIVFSHTVQVWALAVAVLVIGAITTMTDALYFSLVTYTTLGYGDVTLSSDHRLFGAMGAVTGLLNFGLSTAFLVGLLGKLIPDIRDPR